MELDSKIYVSGHRGFIGSAIVRRLKEFGYTNVIVADRSEVNLMDPVATNKFFEENQPEYVFNSAAKVGGIGVNNAHPADFIYENLVIQTNVIHASAMNKVKKFLFMGSVCIYPKHAKIPVSEDLLLTGSLEPTNEAYSTAKIAGIKMCEAYNKQYGFSCLSVMPSNIYGPNDNFDIFTGHVIPSMITKFTSGLDTVVFWGDGTPYREFLFVDDMADACIFLMNSDKTGNAELINVGSGYDISIKELADKISTLTNFNGRVEWDTTMPNGTIQRRLDFSKLRALGWEPKYSIDKGLLATLEWYRNNMMEV